jgi:hypothetical protein
MKTLVSLLLCLAPITMCLLAADDDSVFKSIAAKGDVPLNADPDSPFWRDVPSLEVQHDVLGNPIDHNGLQVRSRWTKDNLYFLFVCKYDQLNLKPNPDPATETNRLWNWDVAETFIGSDFEHINQYKEFEVSPQGEWVDLDIDTLQPKAAGGIHWNSGFKVAAHIDSEKHVWVGAMMIPYAAVDPKPPTSGRRLRINFFRCAGSEPNRDLIAWRPTGKRSFHVPQAFGELELAP